MCGKRKRKDVTTFSIHLIDNILSLRHELFDKTYRHGSYHAFKINDPKPRDIHKACVRDRLLHHAIYRTLYPYFDRIFIFDSYSCRINKGTYRATDRFNYYARVISHNYTRTVWVLKCDIRKFFASINHEILKNILRQHIEDCNILWLFACVIDSFHTESNPGVGLPLGNLTSQLLVNIYMNEFDQFIKRELKIHYYVRYADDFVLVHNDRRYLENILVEISQFLNERLKLSLHPDKVFIRTFASGIDFLGWTHFPYCKVLRTSTKRRMFRKLDANFDKNTITSYKGLLSYGNTYKLSRQIPNARFEN